MREIGLEVSVDPVGNIRGRLEGSDKTAPSVATGSHIDTVPHGGNFDGVLGVVVGLEVIRTVVEENIDHINPIELVIFVEEEGCNFGNPMAGSKALTGRLNSNDLKITDKNQFSQIAYNLRPMIFACLEAFNVTSDTVYAIQAGEIASWFLGNNVAHKIMYIESTGICYDGINSGTDVNKNSGAESTIETLLSLQAIESNSIARDEMLNVISIINK